MSKCGAIFGITRGGSSITGRLLHILAEGAGWHVNDVGGQAYDSGMNINEIPEQIFEDAKVDNTLIGPFRELPVNAGPLLGADVAKVFVFRDPRDCLVSHYFAFKNIHTVFEEGGNVDLERKGRGIAISVDQYVLENAQELKRTYVAYIGACKTHENTLLCKYEDVAFDPLLWLGEVVKFIGFSPKSTAMNQAVVEACFWRVGTDQFDHNRQGQSGDFINHLQPETIQELNGIFAEEMNFLKYEQKPSLVLGRYEDIARDPQLAAQSLHSQRVQIDEMKRAILSLMTANGLNAARFNDVENKLRAQESTIAQLWVEEEPMPYEPQPPLLRRIFQRFSL